MATTQFVPKEININDISYYNADDLKIYDPMFFYGCSRTIRKIISIKSISSDKYMYASWSKKAGWSVCQDQSNPYNKAKLLLKAEWVTTSMPKMMIKAVASNKSESPDDSEEKDAPADNAEYVEAPPIITLEDNEKFTDNDGKAFDIETRGERTYDGIYFLAKDVSNAFGMNDLCHTISSKGSFIRDIHYKTFLIKNNNELKSSTSYKKTMFITYQGIIKILFSSRTGRAKEFRTWATRNMFTIQMGRDEHKEELAASVIGIPVNLMRQVLKTGTTSTTCVYRFSLGKAKTLRQSMNISDIINDDFTIIKYGYTNDLVRRSSEHVKTYEKINGVTLELMNYVCIDPIHLSKAEVDIKKFFVTIGIPVKYESFAELVAISPKHENDVKKQFKYLYDTYSGTIKTLSEKLEESQRENAKLQERHAFEMELFKKELAYEKIKNELLELKLQNSLK